VEIADPLRLRIDRQYWHFYKNYGVGWVLWSLEHPPNNYFLEHLIEPPFLEDRDGPTLSVAGLLFASRA
jgi:hypothetical protein